MPTSDLPKDGNGRNSPGKLELLVRGITPTGVVVIVIAVLGIEGDINRNCNATANLARGMGSIVAVDNELSEPKNRAQRKFVERQLKNVSEKC